MEEVTNVSESTVIPIKERLLKRFGRAKEIVGTNWRNELSATDPFFNTKTGVDYMRSVAQAYSNAGRGHVDRIERVTLALEKIARIQSPPIV
jgi:hypothetical protein